MVLLVKNLPANAGDARDSGLILELGRYPEIGNGKPIPVFLPGVFHGQRSLAEYSPWGRKESVMTEHACARAHTHTHTHTQSLSKITTAFLWSYPVERHSWARN